MQVVPRVVAALLLLFAVRLDAQPLECAGAARPQRMAELMFGRRLGNGLEVSETQWRDFLDREITPRFPEGLTVLDAVGQWRDRASGSIMREPSKVVEIILPGNADDLSRLDQITQAYREQFGQQSVPVMVRGACVSR